MISHANRMKKPWENHVEIRARDWEDTVNFLEFHGLHPRTFPWNLQLLPWNLQGYSMEPP